MRFLGFFIILVFLQNCSFDDKSGIWKNENNISDKKEDQFKDFKVLSTRNSSFNKIIPYKENLKFIINKPKKNLNWLDIFYDKTNNYPNLSFSGMNQLVLESDKISRSDLSNSILLENNVLITSDEKGNIITYSLERNVVIHKFNFYKKRYKKIKKSLNFIAEDGILYVSDNIGYLYALNYNKNKILWAKNYKIPFRSNIKLKEKKIILSNQNNSLFFINKENGNLIKLIPTEESAVKNQFKNNLSMDEKSVFFLNTFGSLYSIDIDTTDVNWFLNLNQTVDLNPSNLFFGSKIINHKGRIAVSSNDNTYIIDTKNGSVLFKFNFNTKIKSVIIDNYFFSITNNDLLIAIDLQKGNIIYSYNLNELISKFLNIKKERANFKNFFIANNFIYIILENSFYLKLSIVGNLEKIEKLPKKIKSEPIFINGNMLYLNSSGRISIVN